MLAGGALGDRINLFRAQVRSHNESHATSTILALVSRSRGCSCNSCEKEEEEEEEEEEEDGMMTEWTVIY